ncbi:MAG: PDZ domain-containing protein, partial [Planctomycetota bacterium]
TRMDGTPVPNITSLRLRVARTVPGTEVTLSVFRRGERRTIRVTVGELPEEKLATAMHSAGSDLKMSVQTLTPALARQLGYEEAVQGVVVTQVAPGGFAARAGVQAKDVIVAVGGEPVRNQREFHREMSKQELGRGVRLDIRRAGARLFLFLQG